MRINILLTIVFAATTIYLTIYSIAVKATNVGFEQVIWPITQCNDGVDNDSDGFIDYASDPQCTSWLDDSEFPDPTPTPTPLLSPTITPTVALPTATVEPLSFTPTPAKSLGSIDNSNDDGGDLIDVITQLPETGADIVQNFVWEPLGQVIGASDRQIEEIGYAVTSIWLRLCSLIYIFLIIAYSVLKLRDREKTQ